MFPFFNDESVLLRSLQNLESVAPGSSESFRSLSGDFLCL